MFIEMTNEVAEWVIWSILLVVALATLPELKQLLDFIRWGIFREDRESAPGYVFPSEARTRWERMSEMLMAFLILLSCWAVGTPSSEKKKNERRR